MNHPTAKAPAPGKEEHQVKAKDATLLQLKRRIQIEEAVERVRSRTSRMKESGELVAVASLWVQEVEKLGLIPAKGAISFSVFDSVEETVSIWLPGTEGLANADYHPIPIRTNKPLEKVYQSWKRKKKLVLVNLSGRSLAGYLKLLSKVPPVRKHRVLKKMIASPPGGLVVAAFSFCQGTVDIIQDSSPSKECLSAIVPFVQAWDQTYTRFLDLKKAEAQAQEAKVEAALERVRARTMRMRQSSELRELVALVYEQLNSLGFNSWAHLIRTRAENKKGFYTWLSTKKKSVLPEAYYLPDIKNPVHQQIMHAWDKQAEFKVIEFGGKQKKAYDDYLFEKTDWKKLPELVKKEIRSHDFSVLSLSSRYNTGLQAIGTERLPEDKVPTFIRFAKVFEQTYTRFLDLQKAEAQAREARIEVSLERVRSRAMAMHRSDELREVVGTLYDQLLAAGLDSWMCILALKNEKLGGLDCFMSNHMESVFPLAYHIPDIDHPYYIEFVSGWEEKSGYKVVQLEGKSKKHYDKILLEDTEWKNLPKEAKDVIKSQHHAIVSVAYLKNGMIQAVGAERLPEEKKIILLRFCRVFEQAYTRFLDLQKAEAQAREAQIETALERIRARALAMHSSDELTDVARVLREQVGLLGQTELLACNVALYPENSDAFDVWVAMRPADSAKNKIINVKSTFRKDATALTRKWYKMYLSNAAEYSIESRGKELAEWIKERNRVTPEIVKYHGNKIPSQINFFFCRFTGGALMFSSNQKHDEKSRELLRRAAKVFDFAYRRFLDLQKAEAQAREAQIEVALERVRARTMSMQDSYELKDAASLLFQQVKDLGIDAWTCGYNIWEDDKKSAKSWLSRGTMQPPFRIPHTENPTFIHFYEAEQRGESLFVEEIGGNALKELYEYLGELLVLEGISGELRKPGYSPPISQVNHAAYFSYGYLLFVTYKPYPEAHDIFRRFAVVFEQTYTRFLDLQKAEGQAREAQIELSLERVRARTMAMHKSEELSETAAVLFQQFNELGNTPERINIGIVKGEEGLIEFWSTEQGGNQISHTFKGGVEEPTTLKKVYAAWKSKEKSLVVDLSGKDLASWIKHLRDVVKMPVNEKLIGNRRVHTTAFFTHGCILMTTPEPLPPESINLLERFAGVFNLTYRRFLDLEQAEAQAREAQIEAALERVRSRSMAMHKSEELSDCAELLFRELSSLGGNLWTSGFAILQNDDTADGEYRTTDSGGTREDVTFIPNKGDPTMQYLYEGWKQGELYRKFDLGGKDIKKHYKNMLALPRGGHVFQAVLDAGSNFPDWQQMHAAYFKHGYLLVISLDDYQVSDLLIRFARVFEQTYTRFLDLKRAEGQARESEIQLALERVRARTMAMHRSDELAETAVVVFQQFKELGVSPERINIGIVKEDTQAIEFWSTDQDGSIIGHVFTCGIDEKTTISKVYDAWKSGEESLTIEQEGDELRQWLHYLRTVIGMPFKEELVREKRYQTAAFFKHGSLLMSTPQPLSPKTQSMLPRFAKVFEQTYTRFLDLQMAEAQARESQIEAALERVRSRSMAMHQSEELLNVITVVSEQLSILGLKFNTVSFAVNSQEHDYSFWFAAMGDPEPAFVQVPYLSNPMYDRMKSVLSSGVDFYADTLTPEESRQWHEHLFAHADLPNLSAGTREYILRSGYARSIAIMPAIMLIVSNYAAHPYADAENDIIKRFAAVFQQSYTRFLDLQRAEAQAREARIEAALERVRARSMAMQKSGELKEVVSTLSEEIGKLDLIFNRTFICIFDTTTMGATWWMSNPESGESFGLFIKYHGLHPYQEHITAWRDRKPTWEYVLAGQDKKEWDAFLFTETDLSTLPAPIKDSMREKAQVHLSCSFGNFGYLALESSASISEAQFDILFRFSKTFDQSYTRFLDIQKAEAQAREAQIETSLERIRARALAMQTSDEITDVVLVLKEQMEQLDQPELAGCVIHIYPEDSDTFDSWFAFRPPNQNELVAGTVKFAKSGTSITRQWLDLYHGDKPEYDIKLSGEDYKEWVVLRNKTIGDQFFMGTGDLSTNYYHMCDFSGGTLITAAGAESTEEVKDLQRRAAAVFDLAYKRYVDLQKAEAREKEAVEQSSLDRVRAEIASMRTAGDLERITPLIWKELTTLNVPFIRCGVFIMDDSLSIIHNYLSTPDGKAIAAFQLSYDTPGFIEGLIENWRNKKMFLDHWDEVAMENFANILVERGIFRSAGQYLQTLPREGFHLHFLPFLQGMLYVGSLAQLSDDNLDLLQALANAFSTAYARYDDFNKLESAKQQIEKTLTELRLTQQQLVQSEKMASLGELTAGIAHEIQNPLNFVNNFSEVSNELIEELNEAMRSGNNDEVKSITDDVKKNLEKILHHGKRADAIVKGMLQHSRSSSGVKEPTDINVLADEYLRLAYHGLRAKDKSFNATMKTEYDETLEKVNVIPQDIGRVILNLITNAFYAVTDKALAKGQSDYQPTVTVTTKKAGNQVTVSVRDNGNGIPGNVVDKIFQPFFTTKPAGQGTGLGLSLSYDIVKAHGGELNVETKAGEGSQFIILLPTDQ